MKNNHNLDFFVIGAQKAGTTSLHYQLSKHPDIALPSNKEAPFFSDDTALQKGLDWYLKEFFPHATDSQLLGSVTPQYMAYPGVAEKMWQQSPKAKIIAILRDPVARARSHYTMRVRAFGEKQSFQQLITEQLLPDQLVISRTKSTPSNSYVIWGEYGRVLEEFISYYPRSQLLIVYLDDMEKNPKQVLQNVFYFLGLKTPQLNKTEKRYNVAHKKRLSLSSFIANQVKNKYLRIMLGWLIPTRLKRRLAFWSIINRNDPKVLGDIDTTLDYNILSRLSKHYLDDGKALEKMEAGFSPWIKGLENNIENH